MSAQMDTMTPEQERDIVECCEECLRIATCCDPADRPRAEAAISQMYAMLGVAPPVYVWCSSPATATIARSLMGPGGDTLHIAFRDQLNAELRDSLGAALKAPLGDRFPAALRAEIWGTLWTALQGSIRDIVYDALRESLSTSVHDALWSSLWSSLRASLLSSLWDSLRGPLHASLRGSLQTALQVALDGRLRDSLRESLGHSVLDSLHDSLLDSLWGSLGDAMGTMFGASIRNTLKSFSWGQHEQHWISYYLFGARFVEYPAKERAILQLWAEAAASCGWWWPGKRVCYVCERPAVCRINERWVPHCEDGPAIAFRDGWAIWAIDGVWLGRDGEQIVMRPETQALTQIDAEESNDIRSIRIERFGWPRYLREADCRVIDTRTHPREMTPEVLYRDKAGTGRLVVIDPATQRQVCLRVPSGITTCEQAQAYVSHGLDGRAMCRT